MALIGEFELAAKRANPAQEPDQFKLNGQIFTVSGKDLSVVMARFANAARRGGDVGEMEGLAAMIDMLTGVVVPEDGARLVDAVDGMDPEDIFKVVAAIIEAQTARPTEQPSDSSAGLSTTGANSMALSSFEASSPLGSVPPILLDPRVQALQPINEAGLSLVG